MFSFLSYEPAFNTLPIYIYHTLFKLQYHIDLITFLLFLTMSTHLLLFLLLISLYPYACNARRHHGLFHTISHKGAEKVKYTMFQEQTHQKKHPMNRESSTTTEKPKELEPLPRIMDEARGITKGVVRTKSLVTVSWKIPHERYAEDPRFDLDYAPPRTHPPSHN